MMAEMNIHFYEEDWQRIERDWSAWWAGEIDRPMVFLTGAEPEMLARISEAPDFVTNLPLEMSLEEVIDRYQARLEATHYYGDSFPKWWLNFGPGIMAGFCGARVVAAPDTVWFEPSQQVAIEAQHIHYDAENFWWQRVSGLTRLAVERWGDKAVVAHTDLGGNLDILASLRGSQQLGMELYDAPEEVDRLVEEITQLWLRYYDELYAVIHKSGRGTSPWASIWSPKRTYMLQSDFAYMISPKMFERFVMPDLVTCCAALDHAFYHLDGKGQIPHLDQLLSIKDLWGIQWVPGDGAPPPEEWLPLLKRIRDGGKLCQVGVSPQGARRIVRELGGKGFCLHVYTADLIGEEAEAFLRTLAQEDISLER
jgi:5-methyltetrahydrofolate--homocysteine methyltransferase